MCERESYRKKKGDDDEDAKNEAKKKLVHIHKQMECEAQGKRAY